MEKLISISALGAALIAALHWMPWHRLVGRELRAPWTYICGVSVIGIMFTVWCAWAHPSWGMSIGGFWSVTAAVGLGDVVAYALDELGGGRMLERTHGRTQERGIERD